MLHRILEFAWLPDMPDQSCFQHPEGRSKADETTHDGPAAGVRYWDGTHRARTASDVTLEDG